MLHHIDHCLRAYGLHGELWRSESDAELNDPSLPALRQFLSPENCDLLSRAPDGPRI